MHPKMIKAFELQWEAPFEGILNAMKRLSLTSFDVGTWKREDYEAMSGICGDAYRLETIMEVYNQAWDFYQALKVAKLTLPDVIITRMAASSHANANTIHTIAAIPDVSRESAETPTGTLHTNPAVSFTSLQPIIHRYETRLSSKNVRDKTAMITQRSAPLPGSYFTMRADRKKRAKRTRNNKRKRVDEQGISSKRTKTIQNASMVTLEDIVASGIVPANSILVCRRSHGIVDERGRILYDNETFATPSDWCKHKDVCPGVFFFSSHNFFFFYSFMATHPPIPVGILSFIEEEASIIGVTNTTQNNVPLR